MTHRLPCRWNRDGRYRGVDIEMVERKSRMRGTPAWCAKVVLTTKTFSAYHRHLRPTSPTLQQCISINGFLVTLSRGSSYIFAAKYDQTGLNEFAWCQCAILCPKSCLYPGTRLPYAITEQCLVYLVRGRANPCDTRPSTDIAV